MHQVFDILKKLIFEGIILLFGAANNTKYRIFHKFEGKNDKKIVNQKDPLNGV